MQTRELGRTGIKWTPIGLGTWNMEQDPKGAVRALQAGVDEGGNHIDTAEMYGQGRVEDIVGDALRGRREKVYLVSKVLPTHASYEGTIQACERSLGHLKTDHLDVYLLHWRGREPLAETVRAFETLKRAGKIRHWGVSNFDVSDMEDLLEVADAGSVACNQVLYHLEERAIEVKLVPWCRERNIPIVAYSPLGQGKMPTSQALQKIAGTRGATPAQVALAFLIREPSTFAIPKSNHEQRTRENIKAGELKLTEKEIQDLDHAFPIKPKRSLPMT